MPSIYAAFPTVHKALQAQQELKDHGFQVMANQDQPLHQNSSGNHENNLVSNLLTDQLEPLTNQYILLTVVADDNHLITAHDIIRNYEGHIS